MIYTEILRGDVWGPPVGQGSKGLGKRSKKVRLKKVIFLLVKIAVKIALWTRQGVGEIGYIRRRNCMRIQ